MVGISPSRSLLTIINHYYNHYEPLLTAINHGNPSGKSPNETTKSPMKSHISLAHGRYAALALGLASRTPGATAALIGAKGVTGEGSEGEEAWLRKADRGPWIVVTLWLWLT